jgi:hypothetical protein
LGEKGTLVHLPTALQGAGVLDRDQQYYLRTMQRIIDSCAQPYYLRKKLFAALRQEQDEAQRSSEFRFVSSTILLPQIEESHRTQARDRARCEAWTLAIAKALGVPLPDFKLNPFTGKPYVVELESENDRPSRVVVTGLDDDPVSDTPVVVPIPRGE